MVYLLMLGAAAVVALAGYAIFRARRDDRAEVCHFCCPKCGQRLRYGAGNQGRRVWCPRCLGRCTLPGPRPGGPPTERPSAATPGRGR
jgi:hypothetical protein